MTHNNATEDSRTSVEQLTDHERLRDDPEVPFHEERDVVDASVLDEFASLPDLAGVGIENADGEALLRRATETCSWKLPVAQVAPEEDFAARITDHVRETLGFDVYLDGIAGVWDIRLRTEDDQRTASRAFVIFSGSTESDDLDAATPTGDPVEEAGWFDELPEGASEVPGTDLFVE
jgi:hypothetical protein